MPDPTAPEGATKDRAQGPVDGALAATFDGSALDVEPGNLAASVPEAIDDASAVEVNSGRHIVGK